VLATIISIDDLVQTESGWHSKLFLDLLVNIGFFTRVFSHISAPLATLGAARWRTHHQDEQSQTEGANTQQLINRQCPGARDVVEVQGFRIVEDQLTYSLSSPQKSRYHARYTKRHDQVRPTTKHPNPNLGISHVCFSNEYSVVSFI